MNLNFLGENIKKARKEKKMTQKELAEKIHRTESSIRKYEKGIIQIPNDIIEKIAIALNISPLDLVGTLDTWNNQFNFNGKLSEETILLQNIEKQYGKDSIELLQLYQSLNDSGKSKILEYLLDLSENNKYKID